MLSLPVASTLCLHSSQCDLVAFSSICKMRATREKQPVLIGKTAVSGASHALTRSLQQFCLG